MCTFFIWRERSIYYILLFPLFLFKGRFPVRLFFRLCNCLSICLSQYEMKLPIHFSRCGSKSTMASELCLSVCLKSIQAVAFSMSKRKQHQFELSRPRNSTSTQLYNSLFFFFAFYSCKWMIYTEIWYSCGIWHFYECNGYVLLNYSRLGDTLSRYMPE